jgi:hypothetical protein
MIPKSKRPEFKVGQRVATLPHTSAWMRGERFGCVHRVGIRLVMVSLDSGRVGKFHPSNIAAA